ncbi:MAG: hypothetical protein K0U84_09180 [Actinomycetia bacterium]|nr:hypothetical protein [Actinomycetes bacterium]
MPVDLLSYVGAPSGYSLWWLVLAALIIVVIAGFYVGVVVWTLPPQRLRDSRFFGNWHRKLLVRKFSATIDSITAQYRDGAISAAHACERYNRTLRSFLRLATGAPAAYIHVEVFEGPLEPAAELIAALNAGRFAPNVDVAVDEFGYAVKEMVRTWS